jgi:LmbE family N-acetylglucosaminyl deacetylase
MNGHADHVAIHRIVRQALARSRCPAAVFYFAGDGTFTESARHGFLPPAQVNRLWLTPTCRIDVRDVVTQKLVAMACHETQARSVVKHLRLYPDRILTESFHAPSGDNTMLEKLLS